MTSEMVLNLHSGVGGDTRVALHRVRRRFWQVGLAMLALTACGKGDAAANAASATRPFTVHAVASFSTPWAMAFLPGSGVELTNLALLTEREGKLWLVDVRDGNRRDQINNRSYTSYGS